MIPSHSSALRPFVPFKAPRQPMLWAAVFYSAGIICGVHVWRPPLAWIIGGSFFLFAAAFFAQRRPGLGWLVALSALFGIGALNIQVRGANAHLDTSIQPYATGQEIQITAHVVHDGRLQPGATDEVRQILDLETEEITTEAERLAIHSGIRISIYSPRRNDPAGTPSASAFTSVFRYGERLRFPAKLR